MFTKRILSSLVTSALLFSACPVLASGILPEDADAICTAMEKITEKRKTGYCQFMSCSPIAKPLLKESIKYALDLEKYKLAAHFIKVFAEQYDINEVENLDYMVVRSGQADLYEFTVKLGYNTATPANCTYENNLLNAAVESGNIKLIKKFLNEGFDPNSCNPNASDRYPLNICLAKIPDFVNNDNGHGLCYEDNRKQIENLVKIIRLLCEKGANPFLRAGKTEDKSALDLLEELNPENKNNCYMKLEFYNKSSKNFCKELYKTLRECIFYI